MKCVLACLWRVGEGRHGLRSGGCFIETAQTANLFTASPPPFGMYQARQTVTTELTLSCWLLAQWLWCLSSENTVWGSN